MQIVLKGKPVGVNSVYQTVCRNNFPVRFMKAAPKALKEEWEWVIASTCKKNKWDIKEGDMYVEVNFYFPDKRSNDLDGHVKMVLDCMTDLVYKDDKQITHLVLKKFYDKKNPRVEINVDEILG